MGAINQPESSGNGQPNHHQVKQKRKPAIVRALYALRRRYYYAKGRSQQDREAQHLEYARMSAVWTRNMGIFTVILACLAAVSVFYTYWQFAILKEQVSEGRKDSLRQDAQARKALEIAELSLTAGQRAWVGPVDAVVSASRDPIGQPAPPVVGQPLYVFLSVRNTGTSPATNANYRETVSLAPLDETKDCLSLPEALGGPAIHPSAEHMNQTKIVEVAGANVDEALLRGEKTIFINACVAYRTFGRIRHTAYCYYFNSRHTSQMHLGICGHGHYAD
jgi:hypothetical protein